MKKFIVFLLALLMVLPGAEPFYAENEAASVTTKDGGEVVIVLDPGHDSTHAGAGGNGLREEKLVLKIGLYLREELNKYENVKVYMTREAEACAFPETVGVSEGSKRCNEARVAYAKSVGADVLIALHLNSFSNNAGGALVFVPNTNYAPEVGKIGQNLGNAIVNKLAELGLENRGIVIKESNSDTRPEEYYYPDGSIADYYRVIRYAKKEFIPALIVEHAFISSTSDVSRFLSSEEGLKALAIKDAQGIVEYYGLTLKEGCETGVLPDLDVTPAPEPTPTPVPTPEPAPEPETSQEPESESETEPESEVNTETQTETEIVTETEETIVPEETEVVDDTEKPNDAFPWEILVVTVIVIAAIAGGIFVLLWYRKKKR